MENQNLINQQNTSSQFTQEVDEGLFSSPNQIQRTADPDDADDRQRNQDAADQSPGILQMKQYHSVANSGGQVRRQMPPAPLQLTASPLHTPSEGESDELEHDEDADSMQLMAVDTPLSTTNNGEVMQRVTKRYKSKGNKHAETRYKTKVATIASTIDSAVQSAREEALNWRDFSSSKGHLGQWYKAANDFYTTQKSKKFIHARFGYAVETLACQKLASTIEGLSVSQQVTSGHTRPDIVVKDSDFTVAWMDITSLGSKEHIFSKSGSGWRNNPFIYEIMYDQLKLSEIMMSDDNEILNEYGKYMGKNMDYIGEAQIENEQYVSDTLYNFRYDVMSMTKIEARKATRKKINEMGIDVGSSFKETKGLLAYLGLSLFDYGFKGSDSGSSQVYREWNTNKSQNDTKVPRFNNMDGKIREAISAVKHKQGHLDLVDEFLGTTQGVSDYSHSKVKDAITIRRLVAEYDPLDDCQSEMHSFSYGVVGTLYEEIKSHLGDFPQTFHAGDAQDWITEADRLYYEWKEFEGNLNMVSEFESHVLKLHKGNSSAITKEEKEIWDNLKAYPLVEDAEGRALRFMSSNPLPSSGPKVAEKEDVKMTMVD